MAGGAKGKGFAGWLAALVLPPAAVAGGLGQRFVSHHAVWAVVIGVVYEAAVAAGGFFAVIARDVSSRWQSRLADRVDLFLQRKLARFDRRYRRFVLSGLRFMDHKGLATVGPFTPELDAVFVDVSLVPRPPQRIAPGILPGVAGDRAGRRLLGDFLGRQMPAVLAVVGAPGSGKTTLLRHAARQACLRKGSGKSRRSSARDIPVLLYLRDHASAITANPAVSVATLLRATLGALGAEEPPEWFERQLRDGRCLVLLDGLDEVARQQDRATVSAWAEGQVRQYPGNDFVISSRPQGYRSAPVEGADILQVCGFSVGQVEDFVCGWYRAVERHSTGTAGPEVETRAADGSADLLQRLEHAPALYDLTVNPLLLTMIANVHRYRGALPGSRADLYAEICQVMLWRRQDAKKLLQQMGGDKKEVILRGLAYTMMKRRVSDFSRDEVLAAIRQALRRVSDVVTPDGFLADVSSNGLLVERETGQYAFAHKTFQEHLAAAHIRDNGLVGDLAQAVNDDWWAETTLLYAATTNADPIIQACLDANSAPALALALDCIQDSDVDPDLRKRVDDLVVAAAGPDADQERRRLFAAILLARYMRQRKRTAEGAQVCAQPIPAEIYRLFLADTQTPERNAPSAESAIAVGMRSSDAAAFVGWVNALSADATSGEQRRYRLPTAAELTEFAAQQRIPALPTGRPLWPWIQADGASPRPVPVLWVRAGGPEPYELDNAQLADACRGDLARSGFALSGLLMRSRIVLLTMASDLEHELGRAHVRAYDRALARRLAGRAPGLYTASDRASGYDFGLALDSALDRGTRPADAFDFTRDLSDACNLGRNVAGAAESDLASDLERACDLTRDLAINLDHVRAGIRDGSLQRAIEMTPVLAATIDRISDRRMTSSLSYRKTRPVLDMVCCLALGRAFSNAASGALRSRVQTGEWVAHFAQAFIDAAGIAGGGHLTADPETMGKTLREAAGDLEDIFGNEQGDRHKVSAWSARLAGHLRRTAEPIFAGAERPTPDKATAIRIAALCLAAETEAIQRQDIGDMFRRIAAGITLLERRSTGELQAAEVIMLAADRPSFEAGPPVRRGRALSVP